MWWDRVCTLSIQDAAAGGWRVMVCIERFCTKTQGFGMSLSGRILA